MFPDSLDLSRSAWFWAAAAVAGLLYLGLFGLTGRPAALRFGRVGGGLLVAASLGLALAAAADRNGFGAEIVVILGLAAGGGVLLLLRHNWLVREGRDELREQIVIAARGLLLECEERTPGILFLGSRRETARLRLVRLGARLQLLVLPRPAGAGKIALLRAWLSKQYPGPVPRLRIVLNRREP